MHVLQVSKHWSVGEGYSLGSADRVNIVSVHLQYLHVLSHYEPSVQHGKQP